MTAPIDPSSIGSWEDAFQHPIPQVRQLERQLRADLASRKERLRGLVGESYRDLLQTAERIIDMDVAAQNVEAHLGEASRNCNSRLLEQKARNLRIFGEMMDKRDREKYTFAAQLAVLQACPSVISWLLHKEQETGCLLAAKVFVVSRLLLKSLSEKSSLPLLTDLRSQCSTLRPILLQYIDTLLSSITLNIRVLVSALTAFSVLKTSSPSEVLRHFLYIRSTALSSLLANLGPDAILNAVTLFNKTLSEADTVFPNKLGDALVTLKSKSLLQDADVTALPELGLDINAQWLPDDIRGFTPWVRHDDLEKARVEELVRVWAEKETAKLNASLQITLEAIHDIATIVELRSGVLSLWRVGSQIRSKFFPNGSVGGEIFRNIIMARIIEAMESVAQELHGVAEKAQSLLPDAENEAEDSTSLWPTSPLLVDLANGALAFRTSISDRVHGRSPVVLTLLSTYNSWLSRISLVAAIARDLRNPNTPTESEDEDFDAEEERTQAGIEDSFLAEKELAVALDNVYHLFERALDSLLDLTPITRRQTTFLLRTVRQIRSLPPRRQGDDGNPILSLGWFGVEMIPKLHILVAMDVIEKPLKNVTVLLRRRRWEEGVVSKPLWEGELEQLQLPVQPSPVVFRFLHDLITEMRTAGEDIWTPAAVKCVKARACNGLWAAMEEVLQGREFGDPEPAPVEGAEGAEVAAAPNINGTSTPAKAPRITRDWTLQLLFDSLYLDEALHRKRRRGSTNGSSIISLVGKVDSTIGAKLNLDEELRIRLEGSASEYWKRTCLLFALLS